ncbi:MAG: 2-dehydropantoate 2-reductase [Chloroflexi bacterium]|nr:2-dehydropantoate 2-reductase [Chloroflexota bacterium]
MNSDVLIVGTGALATLFAARLTSAGCAISMLGTWPEGLTALRANGARLVDANGNAQTFNVRVADDPKTCRGAKYALVLVKAWQTERAARQLAECLADDGLAVTLQNGLGNREILAAQLGDSRMALGTTTTGATLLGPGLVRAGGEGKISIEAHPALGPIEEALRSAKFNVEIVDDAQSLVWGKLVVNAAINPLTALLRIPNGELLKRPTARALMRALAEEAAAVASAEKIKLTFNDAAAAVEEVARKTALNHSSMFQDVQRGAPTEIDAICGAVARAGQKHGIPTPINAACWQLVKALTVNERHSSS